ncbi:MAG: LacI family DNA-binding transcriptional regulator [Sphaerochaeta associata]|uniref:LacI family DNA-binding transcriptional regulator n=1 Tax=Sphaerochaeta associata TaxID=1129264 RepID=UPI002B210AE0|nr:LacI family DNA-binding transcriptional regulator [Sphaerochaeta associata]MEA5105936.1 LacI family DNA-binding transcriptional regulator [Sphaerochaeta associata]
MATIKDVAEKAGITVTTVSRVLNNRGYISAKTREKVYRVMQELDYQPNEIARALAHKQTKFIGAIVPAIMHPFFSACLNYIEKYASLYGFKLLVCNSERNSEKEIDYIEMLKSNKVSGIILCTRSGNAVKRLEKFPVITIERSISDTIPAVMCDNYHGGQAATELLIAKGCKNPVIISGNPRVQLPADDRARAFHDVCCDKGITPKIFTTNEHQFNKRDYRAEITKIFDENPSIDGVFASSDVIAAQVLQVCNKRMIRVPEQMKIIGFDDVEIASLTTPPLSTIHQPIEDMCKYAVEMIIRRIKGETIPIKTVLPISLIERETT